MEKITGGGEGHRLGGFWHKGQSAHDGHQSMHKAAQPPARVMETRQFRQRGETSATAQTRYLFFVHKRPQNVNQEIILGPSNSTPLVCSKNGKEVVKRKEGREGGNLKLRIDLDVSDNLFPSPDQ